MRFDCNINFSFDGHCLACYYNTTGYNCQNCLPGFWGDAINAPKGDCKQCNCYPPGSLRPTNDYSSLECKQDNGQCDCQPYVTGKNCDRCETGFFNITSGTGCRFCDCDTIGSVNSTCDVVTGACICKPGITGRRCDQCAPYHYSFGPEGSKACNCDGVGSESADCDVNTGQCLCKENVVGRRCDQCADNWYNLRRGCLPCDDCYTLIQQRKNSINKRLIEVREKLDEVQHKPVKVDDDEFKAKFGEVEQNVEKLWLQAKKQKGKRVLKVVGVLVGILAARALSLCSLRVFGTRNWELSPR